jgi:hypothetical protein
MENGEHQSLEQIQAFLTGNKEIEFKAPNRKELYEWTQQALCGQSYSSLHRSGKDLMKRYIGKATGLSRAQVTRLIGQYTKSGIVRSRQGRGQRFNARYDPGDVALLAAVDEAHDTLSGPATQKILHRQYHEFAEDLGGAYLQPAQAAQLPRAADGLYKNPAHAGVDRRAP